LKIQEAFIRYYIVNVTYCIGGGPFNYFILFMAFFTYNLLAVIVMCFAFIDWRTAQAGN